ncbi:oligosaccharide flippase family protein [Aliikangiella marina]|uniref:Oligosaccharide flippase family protein n=1 Tax=Aliikangiella marina TaxID=1712262 RepID=A0A545T992_9GAMM|nr:oligosaccharide flippase family protein [Aliikangiella marina]TQV73786.1 oligosaccharide flippase family protein [Aliikangiella marina]
MKVNQLRNKIGNLIQNRFVRNASWIGASELVNRVTRLITAIILARYLSPLEFGIAAVALTTNDLIKVLAQNGIGAKIIQAKDSELESVCRTAYRLNWYFCGGLFILQCLVAFCIAYYYQSTDIALMIATLALVYLMMPFALVEAFLIQRQNRLNVTAVIGVSQTATDNVLTVLLALSGLGVWAVILPKVVVGPIWVFGTLSQQTWRADKSISPAKASTILNYGKAILGSEVNKALRLNVDTMLVAFFLGLEASGIYFFAKNAGLGISLSLINAFNTSLFAHLCDLRNSDDEVKAAFSSALKTILFILAPLIFLQGSLAYWYVPWVFGEQWTSAIPVLMLMCFSAIPRPFAEATSELLKAKGLVNVDLKWNTLFTGAFLMAICIGQLAGIVGVAFAVFAVHLLCPCYCVWSMKRFFNHHPKSAMQLASY